MDGQGVIYIAYGANARNQTQQSIGSLRRFHDWPIVVVSGQGGFKGVSHIAFQVMDSGARWAKVNLDKLTPFDLTLYCDADTRIEGDLSVGFEILQDGWELVITPSQNQDEEVLWHCSESDKWATFEEYGTSDILQLQGGLFWFRKCDAIARFFEAWRDEWEKFKEQDQGALLRALRRAPVKMWLMGRDWNGGKIVKHLWGQARQ